MAQPTAGLGPSTSLNAAHWRRLREEAIERTGGQCERCPRHPRVLFLHHRTYERFGAELPEDVEILCQSCHKLLHFANGLGRPEGNRRPKTDIRGRRRRVAAIVKAIRMGTACERCGDPERKIEWHHPEHPQHPERRVANLIGHAPAETLLETVLAEIGRCEAVCRRCHTRGDGRAQRLRTKNNRGEANSRAKLTRTIVAEIRAAYASDSSYGRQAILGREYSVPRVTVNHILRGRTWREVA